LGAGKTIFVKGYVEGRGFSPDEVQSPTYAYLNRYGKNEILHADLYRVPSLQDAIEKGIIDQLQNAPCRIVERPQRIQMYVQPGMLHVSIKKLSQTDRMVHVTKV
jgi:tRNA threonylcarbamoyladenosine biosynthesis protein TsaE